MSYQQVHEKRACWLQLITLALTGCATNPAGGIPYRSVGILQINLAIPPGGDNFVPAWQPIASAAANSLRSDRVIREAMNDPAWKRYCNSPPETYLNKWKTGLTVTIAPDSSKIVVTYVDDGNDARAIAPVAVSALLHAFELINKQDLQVELDTKIRVWQERLSTLDKRVDHETVAIDEQIKVLGDNPQSVVETKFQALIWLERQVKDLEEELRLERAKAVAPKDLPAKEVALTDLKNRYNASQSEIDDLGHRSHRVSILRSERTCFEEERVRIRARIIDLQNQAEGVTFKVIDYGGVASKL